MAQLFIVAIAIAGMIWNVDPVLRPYIDALMALMFAGLFFYLGDIVEQFFARWEMKPHWRKCRPTKGRRKSHSGVSTPLLER
jgi:hypothetical protein